MWFEIQVLDLSLKQHFKILSFGPHIYYQFQSQILFHIMCFEIQIWHLSLKQLFEWVLIHYLSL